MLIQNLKQNALRASGSLKSLKILLKILSYNTFIFVDVLLTVNLSISISVFNQLDAQYLFHNKFYFVPLHVSSTCAHHQEVKIALHSLWYHHTYTCDDTRHEIKLIVKQILCIKLVKYWDKHSYLLSPAIYYTSPQYMCPLHPVVWARTGVAMLRGPCSRCYFVPLSWCSGYCYCGYLHIITCIH